MQGVGFRLCVALTPIQAIDVINSLCFQYLHCFARLINVLQTEIEKDTLMWTGWGEE